MTLYPLKFILAQAWNSLVKHPLVSFNIITTIAMTLGALLCSMTLIYLMLFKPLPYPDLDQLYVAEQQMINQQGQPVGKGFSYPEAVRLYQQQTPTLETALLYHVNDVISSLPSQPTLSSSYISPEWFGLLGASFVKGRGFTLQEGVSRFKNGAVIGYQTWQKHFNGDQNILSKSLEIRGVSHPIIGVLDASFIEPEIYSVGRNTQIWLPWDFNWTEQMRWGAMGKVDESVQIVVKTNTLNDFTLASHEITQYLNDLWHTHLTNEPLYSGWQNQTSLTKFQEAIFSGHQQLIYYSFFGCLAIFAIAMTNITSMFLSRTVEQQRNLSIHAAMGAKSQHTFQMLLAEYGLLMLLATPLSLLVAQLGFTLLSSQLQGVMPRTSELSINGLSIIFSLVVIICLSIIITLVCNRIVPYKNLNKSLKSSGKGTGIQISPSIRNALISCQIAIASTLIFININVFDQAYHSVIQPLGIELDNRYQLRLMAHSPSTQSNLEKRVDLETINQALRQHPSINTTSISLSPLIWFGNFPVETPDQQHRYSPQVKFVDHDYFVLLSQSFISGENFSAQHIQDKARVMVVNHAMAELVSTGSNVINSQLQLFGQPYKIIGVVDGLTYPNERNATPRVYIPDSRTRPNIMVHAHDNIELNRQTIIDIVESATNRYKVYEFRPMVEDKVRLQFIQYTTMIMTAALTTLTLFLAAIGLYGILSYSSQLRQVEIGTRLAIGAKGSSIIAMIMYDNAKAILVGLFLSCLLFSLLFVSYSNSMSFISSRSIIWLAPTTMLICFIAFIACYLPIKGYISQPVIRSLRINNDDN